MPRRESGFKPRRFRPGMRAIPARQLNALVDLARDKIGVNSPAQSRSHGKLGSIRRLIVDAINNDTLTCHPPNDVSTQIIVAKPYELQRTPFDGQTIGGVTYSYSSSQVRQASDGTNTETQQVIPAYRVGVSIYAAQRVKDGTDVTGATFQELDQGRAWAAEMSLDDPFARMAVAEA